MTTFPEKDRDTKRVHILLAEDDPGIAAALQSFFLLDSYECESFVDGRAAFSALERNKFDLAVIDLMLPGCSGFELTRLCREKKIPVIIMTARTDLASEVKGFDLGAEDYLIKPFHPLRLMTRIKKIVRQEGDMAEEIVLGELSLNTRTKAVRYEGKALNLTPLEYEILIFFARHPDRTWSKDEILDAVWGADYIGDPNTFNVHLRQLRRKSGNVRLIETVGRHGFILRSQHGDDQ